MNDGAITGSPHLPRAFPFYVLTPCSTFSALTCINDFLNVESAVMFFVCTLMFGLCVPSGKPSHPEGRDPIYHPQKSPPAPLKSVPPGPSPAPLPTRQPPVCILSVLIGLHFLEFYKFACFIWLLSLKIMILTFIHGVAYINGSFLGIFLDVCDKPHLVVAY